MLTVKYEDLTDNRTFSYQLLSTQVDSLEREERKLERRREILNCLVAKIQEQKEITYEQYRMVMAWMEHTDEPWFKIFEAVFEKGEFPKC